MQFFIDIIVVVLTSYLAFTNFLATGITNLIGQELPENTSELTKEAGLSLASIPSTIARIPDILLRSSEYQQAAVISGTESTITTTDPIAALVNIYCTFTTDRYIRTTTGTGFFVHQDGVILTNAHVAQFLLLEETTALGDTKCVVRNGSPAAPRYNAELLYIPPAWVLEHAALIDSQAPSGTGERDYALLYVTNSLDNTPLPAVFPALSLNAELISQSARDAEVVAAGYPAGSLVQNGSDTDLLPRQADTTVSELYTFGSQYADVVALRGSSMGEQGSSGGPILTLDGNVIGMITTRGNDERDGTGSLRAITISHINRTITEETGFSLENNISGNIPYRAEIFTRTMAPFLTQLLINEVDTVN